MKPTGNGCGPEWLNKRIKDLLFNWFFEASCDKHDKGYGRGGDEARRVRCDYAFLAAMIKDVSQLKFYQRPFALCLAVLFFFIVRTLGWVRYNYKRL